MPPVGSRLRALARVVASTLATTLLAAPLGLACARADSEVRALPASEGPVLVELFTSQGCSSCPPADRLLGRLAARGAVGDRAVIPLAFHVDYWNDLGWADPFSRAEYTARQQQYAQAIGDPRIYTPELVVGGAAGMNGADVVRLSEAVRRAERPARLGATHRWEPGALTVSATAPADAEVWVAVWQEATSTEVRRGENAGQTLPSAHVVRALVRVAARGQAGTATVKLDPGWPQPGAVAFAQRTDRRIVATTALPRAEPAVVR